MSCTIVPCPVHACTRRLHRPRRHSLQAALLFSSGHLQQSVSHSLLHLIDSLLHLTHISHASPDASPPSAAHHQDKLHHHHIGYPVPEPATHIAHIVRRSVESQLPGRLSPWHTQTPVISVTCKFCWPAQPEYRAPGSLCSVATRPYDHSHLISAGRSPPQVHESPSRTVLYCKYIFILDHKSSHDRAHIPSCGPHAGEACSPISHFLSARSSGLTRGWILSESALLGLSLGSCVLRVYLGCRWLRLWWSSSASCLVALFRVHSFVPKLLTARPPATEHRLRTHLQHRLRALHASRLFLRPHATARWRLRAPPLWTEPPSHNTFSKAPAVWHTS